MGESAIQWTDYTFNPWLGCAKVHAGCTNCYAEVHQAVAMRKGGRVQWGEVWQGGQRVVVADSTWEKPKAWARAAAKEGVRKRVFCASLSDVLEVPRHPREWPSAWTQERVNAALTHFGMTTAAMDIARERLWETIRQTSGVAPDGSASAPANHLPGFDPMRGGLDWLLLTKRPENWRLVPEDVRPLVWLGTSIADQATAEELVDRLLEAQGFRYRFLSLEPMVGPADIDLGRCESHNREHVAEGHPDFGEYCTECAADGWSGELSHGHWLGSDHGVDWVIVGGESGSKARACEMEWIRDVVRQCSEAGVPVFVKQLGAHWADANRATMPDGKGGTKRDDHGGWMPNFPEELRVRQWPGGSQ